MHDSEIKDLDSLETRIWGFPSLTLSFSGFSLLQASKISFTTCSIHPTSHRLGFALRPTAIRKGGRRAMYSGPFTLSMNRLISTICTLLFMLYCLQVIGFFQYLLSRVHSFYLFESWLNRNYLSKPETEFSEMILG